MSITARRRSVGAVLGSFPVGGNSIVSAQTAGIGLLSAVAVVLIALRWMWRSQYLFDLDSILYARALDNFDLRLQQPPLPGYFVYVEVGRLIRAVLVDPNLSLEFFSASLGVLLTLVLFMLGRELYDTPTGLIAAVLGLTGPVFWYQSSFASPRIAEAFLATLVVWIGVRYRMRREFWVFWILAITVGFASGVRQQLLLYLIPFCVWSTWRTPLQWRVAGAAVGSLIVLSWLIPTVLAAGGIQEYRRLSDEQWQLFVVNQTGVLYAEDIAGALQRLFENVARIGLYTFFVCPLGFATLLIVRNRTKVRAAMAGDTRRALLAATIPAVLFFTFIHIQQIGHIMAVAPLFVIVVAHALRQLSHRWIATVSVATVVANLLFVVLVPGRLVGDRIGTPTLAAIRQRDEYIASTIATLQAGSPDETVVIASPLSYGFVEEYAPNYQYFLLPGLFEPDNGGRLSADQAVLSNGLRPVAVRPLTVAGTVFAPEAARRFVTVGYDADISRMVRSPDTLHRAQPDVPSLAVIDTTQPTAIQFGPQHLEFVPARSVQTPH